MRLPLRHDHPLAATLLGALDRVRVRRGLAPLGPQHRADGKVALVTGAASGLGFATSVDLARRGARVLMADCRDLDLARSRALALCPGGSFETLAVDLADLGSIDRFAAGLAERGARVDLIVLNAAVVPTAARTTPQGLDAMFAVNYFSSFALLDRLLQSGVVASVFSGGAVPATRPRIVFVCSEGHRWAEGRPFAELATRRDPAVGRVLAYYGEHKMLIATLAFELDRRLNPGGAAHAGVFALCPGAMNTNIARDVPRVLRPVLRGVMRAFFQDPFAADEPVLYLAVSPAMERRSGVYLHKMTVKDPDARALDPARGRALWEESEALLARLRGLGGAARLAERSPHR